MTTATAKLKSVSPYSQSRRYTEPAKNQGESDNDYNQRTWREHQHVNAEGLVFIPPMALKLCLTEAARYLQLKIPGKKSSTYTKHFMAGLLVADPVVLPLKKEEVESETHFMDANGRRGSGIRVPRTYPVIREWGGDAIFYILDETLLQSYTGDGQEETVFEYVLRQAGNFIGIGRFRPICGGYYGRFTVEKVSIDG